MLSLAISTAIGFYESTYQTTSEDSATVWVSSTLPE